MRARSRSRTPMMTWSIPAIPLGINLTDRVCRVDLTTEAVRHREELSPRRKPGPTLPLLLRLTNGSRLSPGRRFRARCLRGGSNPKDRVFVNAGAHLAIGEDAVAGDPGEGFLVDFLRVGLEDEALAGAPAARIHHVAKARREFLTVVMGVEVGPQIDVALRQP